MKSYFEAPGKPSEDQGNAQKKEVPRPEQFYQRGLGMAKEVKSLLKQEYFSELVAFLRANDHTLSLQGVTIHLAREFGFCYGVDRAVDYAYQAREKFPERRIFITGEIIHNPFVNKRLTEMNIRFLSGQYAGALTVNDLNPDDVVILPAFGLSIQQFQELKQRGCVMVDTTCGSVLNVWKRVCHYASNGFTSIIHGKYFHEETIATSSQALRYENGHYLIVRDMEETRHVCDYLLNGRDRAAFMKRFANSMSPKFDPERDLMKIGVANQTTMLSSESLAIAEELKAAMLSRFGEEKLNAHFKTFDTICSATQDRQDAVLELVKLRDLDFMLVIGGFNSSNTNHLAEISSEYTKTFHIDDPDCISDDGWIRHKQTGSQEVVRTDDWLPPSPFTAGITAGASTPNNKIGEAIERIMRLKGVDVPAIRLAGEAAKTLATDSRG